MIRNMQHNNGQNIKHHNGSKRNFQSKTFFNEEKENGNTDKTNALHPSLNEDFEQKVFFLKNDVGNEVEEILLVGETVNKAVLDSGASKTVCGEEWYRCYVDSLDEKSKSFLEEYSSDTIFRFGVGFGIIYSHFLSR